MKVSQAQVETTRAQLENARWDLAQTTVVAPGNGTMVNVMLRPGLLRRRHAVQRGDDLRRQRVPDLRAVRPERAAPGRTRQRSRRSRSTPIPGRIIKAHVDSIIWAQAQGQLDASGDLPRTTISRAARAVPREARRRRARQGAVPRRRRARLRGDLHRAPRADSHHPQGASCGCSRISTTSSSSTASAWDTDGEPSCARMIARLAGDRCSPGGRSRPSPCWCCRPAR